MDQEYQKVNTKESGHLEEVKPNNLKLPQDKFLRWLGIICLFFILYFFGFYRLLPPKKVIINEVFTIHRGQTVVFGKNNYLTYCGNVGSDWGGDRTITVKVKINNVISQPCTRVYELFSRSRSELPYVIDVVKESNPTQLAVRTPDQYYAVVLDIANKEGRPTYYPGSTREPEPESEEEFYERAYFSYLFEQYYPKLCHMQTRYPANECLELYTRSHDLGERCKINISSESILSSEKFSDMDECLVDQIIKRHVHSDNCLLLIKDPTKKNICFEERKEEEDYLETLRN